MKVLLGACKRRSGISSSHLAILEGQVNHLKTFVFAHEGIVDPLLSVVCELKTKLDEHGVMRVKLVKILQELESDQSQLYLDIFSHSAGLNMVGQTTSKRSGGVGTE